MSGITYAELAARSVLDLRGVGEARASALASVGITSVLDLLTHYPRRYVDRTKQAAIADLELGARVTVVGEIRSVRSVPARGRGKSRVEALLGDGHGRLTLTFFNQPWRERQLREGLSIAVFGKVDRFGGRTQMVNPVVDLLGDRTGKIIPIYPQSEKANVHTWELATLVEQALERCRARGIADPVPEPILDRLDLVSRDVALRTIHTPERVADAEGPARDRLVFDELLRIQLVLAQRKRDFERSAVGIAHVVGGTLVERFVERLPFSLTDAQSTVIVEIEADLARPSPMHRLLQGDVGAGKTVVAVASLLAAVEGGHQGALLAPTQVLAEQHHLGISELLDGFTVPDAGRLGGERPLEVRLLTTKVGAKERRALLAALAAGDIDVVVGTHALLQDDVAFRSLGVVVIDEQHRFGVEQRSVLRGKAAGDVVPDVLVMTATPIPRTAAMTVYGDLDVSVLGAKPTGRTPVRTVHLPMADEETAWQLVRAEAAEGRQAFVVCPLVEDSDKLEVASAEATYDELANGPLAGLRLGLLHGRMPALDKADVMDQMRTGRLDVLVATTVIEVGVDVPNATVMVIRDADRFGIAQLHQLRGRVGRASLASTCFLVTAEAEPSPRVEALVASDDGFALAEVDLDLRGEGTVMDEAQSGRSDLKLASLRRDRVWVERARDAAFALVDAGLGVELTDELRLFLGSDEEFDERTEFLLKG